MDIQNHTFPNMLYNIRICLHNKSRDENCWSFKFWHFILISQSLSKMSKDLYFNNYMSLWSPSDSEIGSTGSTLGMSTFGNPDWFFSLSVFQQKMANKVDIPLVYPLLTIDHFKFFKYKMRDFIFWVWTRYGPGWTNSCPTQGF